MKPAPSYKKIEKLLQTQTLAKKDYLALQALLEAEQVDLLELKRLFHQTSNTQIRRILREAYRGQLRAVKEAQLNLKHTRLSKPRKPKLRKPRRPPGQ